MGRLIRVELSRYGSRRAIALLILLAALLAALVAFKTAWDTRPPSKLEVATAQARAEHDATRSDIRADVAGCLKSPEKYLGTGATAQECRDQLTAASASYLPREELDLEGTLKGNGLGLAVLVIGLIIIAASTFAGSDWASGSIGNQLLFESRRDRVWSAKAVSVTLASGLAALVVLGGFWLTMYLIAADRGVPHGSSVVDDVSWHLVRAVVMAMAAGLGAFALTMLFRYSVATLALLFAYAIGGELVVTLLPIDGIARWSLGNNVFGWLETRLEVFGCSSLAPDCSQTHISHLDSGLYLLVLLVLAVGASWLAFRRQDV
jgi:ABC-2 type transport system permease protein